MEEETEKVGKSLLEIVGHLEEQEKESARIECERNRQEHLQQTHGGAGRGGQGEIPRCGVWQDLRHPDLQKVANGAKAICGNF